MIEGKRFCDFCGNEIEKRDSFRQIIWRSELVNTPKDMCIDCWNRSMKRFLEMSKQQEDEALAGEVLN